MKRRHRITIYEEKKSESQYDVEERKFEEENPID
jgi:hypothetical protein